jgi:hypothetical protein
VPAHVVVQPGGSGILGDRRGRHHHVEAVEAVEAAGPDVQLGLATGVPDPARVRHVLVPERLGRADVDERWRQVRQTGLPGRRRVRRDVGPPRASPSSALRPVSFDVRSPDAEAGHLLRGHRVVAIVQHRVDQHLPEQIRTAPVAGHQRQRGRQPAARAAPGDDRPGSKSSSAACSAVQTRPA